MQTGVFFSYTVKVDDVNNLTNKTIDWLHHISHVKIKTNNERIEVKFGGAYKGIQNFVGMNFIFNNNMITVELDNTYDPGLSSKDAWLWKSDIEDYFKFMGVQVNEDFIRSFYTKEDINRITRGIKLIIPYLYGIITILFLIAYFIYNVEPYKILVIAGVSYPLVLILVEIGMRPLRNLKMYNERKNIFKNSNEKQTI